MDYSPDKVKCFGPGIEETVVPKQETHFTIDTTKVRIDRGYSGPQAGDTLHH